MSERDIENDHTPDDDRDGLRPTSGVWEMGYVNEVNGNESLECSEYRPSRHELELLARHWFDELYRLQTGWWLYAQIGSDECRIITYAQRRLNRIETILGEDVILSVKGGVEVKFRRMLGEKAWNAYLRGDTAYRDHELDGFLKRFDAERGGTNERDDAQGCE